MSTRNTAYKLPIGIQDFGDLISSGYLYVDKTRYLYDMISRGKPYFISRPRRFGKSLTVSTLEAIFRGRRDLFKGLWIDSSDWTWEVYPIIRLDMGKVTSFSTEDFVDSLIDQMVKIAHQYQVELPTNLPYSSIFDTLILKLSEFGKVVVLVDEYDKPLIDQISNTELAVKIRDHLKKLYEIIKANDQHLKFVFLTGVTKFSKVSVFSGLNNLMDITLSSDYSCLMGYTKEELEHYFHQDVNHLSKSLAISDDECYAQIKDWYNGYRFSVEEKLVYNPFSVLNLFNDRQFKSYWFTTGTPTFLLELLKESEFDPINLETIEVGESGFESFEIENIPMLPLLYQTGYLTIREYNPRFRTYKLSYPNNEVKEAFTNSLLHYFSTEQVEVENNLSQIYYNMDAKIWDYEDFIALIKKTIALVPYDLYIKKESYYHSLLYLILSLSGLKTGAQVHTQRGCADIVVKMKNKAIIFEVKRNKTAQAAIEQIKNKKYFEIIGDSKNPVYLVGINFSDELRTIDDYKVEVLGQ